MTLIETFIRRTPTSTCSTGELSITLQFPSSTLHARQLDESMKGHDMVIIPQSDSAFDGHDRLSSDAEDLNFALSGSETVRSTSAQTPKSDLSSPLPCLDWVDVSRLYWAVDPIWMPSLIKQEYRSRSLQNIPSKEGHVERNIKGKVSYDYVFREVSNGTTIGEMRWSIVGVTQRVPFRGVGSAEFDVAWN